MSFLSAELPDKLPIADSGIIAGLGYVTVFAGIIALLIVVSILGACFKAAGKKKAAAPAAEAPKAPAPEAPGAAGQLMLHDVEPKTAAMLMAIVADKMGKPLNQLRFISIKEVKQ